MGIQLLSGFLIATFLVANTDEAFNSVRGAIETLVGGRVMRFIHANCCSVIFFLVIFHLGKNMFFSSSSKNALWITGVLLMVVAMRISFLRYVLP
jgi:ubiquinol-cytochrome c reductase cytochrome b/c1 subunit